MSLKAEASKGVLWVTVERFGNQILQAVIFVILARLLTPEDFGLVAMIMVFFAISQSFIDSGMGQALIREKEITVEDRSTVFWFNLLISFVFYGLLYIAAPYISIFYERPELTNLTRFMGLAVIAKGLAIVQSSELTQQLEFKKQAYAKIPSVFVAGIISIWLALYDYGVWSLAVLYLITTVLNTIMLWIIQPTKINLIWGKESFARLFGFGYKLLISGLINTSFNHIYELVIGKIFSAAILGFYAQAKKLQQMFSSNVIAVIQKVTYPLLAKANDNPEILKKGYRQIIKTSSFIIIPGVILLILLAEPLMIYVFGNQWKPAAPYLQIICFAGILTHLHSINLNVLKVLGRSDLFLKLEIIKRVNTSIAIVIGVQFGIFGLLIGQVISSYIALFINTWYTAIFLNYSFVEQAKDVGSVSLLSVPMTVILSLLMMILPVTSLYLLVVYILFACIIYVAGSLIYRTEVVNTVLKVATPYLSKFI